MKITCFLDMDGVLVNFMGPFLHLFEKNKGREGWPEPVQFTPGGWALFTQEHQRRCDYYFWKGLPWTAKGRAILELVEEIIGAEDVYLLTAPMEVDGCLEGKRQWVIDHLPSLYHDRVIYTTQKHLLAGINCILVDDSETNVKQFRQYGGQALLVPGEANHLHDKPLTIPYLCKELIGLQNEAKKRVDFYNRRMEE